MFLHGRYSDPVGGDLVAERLEGQAGFLSLDFPGFGHSSFASESPLAVSDLLELSVAICRRSLKNNPDSRLVLVGHDFGGLIAQLAACVLSAESGERVDLVLISPLTLGWERLGDVPSWLHGTAARRELRHFLRHSILLTPDQKGQILAPRGKILSRIVESWPGPREKAMWRSRMGLFPGSLLVLWGARDPLSAGLLARDILNLYRNVEYFEHERAGHWPFLEDPAWVAEKIRVFLFRTEPALKTA